MIAELAVFGDGLSVVDFADEWTRSSKEHSGGGFRRENGEEGRTAEGYAEPWDY